MRFAFLFYALLIPFGAFAQDILIQGNPYDAADDVTKSRKAFQREKWFYEQRMYPNNFIPEGAYEKAYNEKEALKQDRGFSMQGVFDTWTSLGPRTGFYFSYSNITSRMTTVKYDPVNPNIIYAGAAFGGLWKSSDGGNNWTPLTDYEPSLSTGSVAVDPSNTNVVYYGTGEATYSGASYYGRGLLKSTDGGNTWKNVQGYFAALSFCSRIVIRPGSSDNLLAAMGNDGLYRSTDAGETWTKILAGRCDDVVYSPTGDTAYAVGSGVGYSISTNGGASFTSNGSLTMGTRNHIAICRNVPSVLYFARYSGSSITVFKSTNGGFAFSQIVSGQNFSGSQAWYDFYMHVNPFDPNYAYVGSIDIWRTTNGGATNFTNITNGYGGGNVHVDQHNVDFHPFDSQQMLCVNDGGIWKSTNRGSSWVNLNTNQTLTQFYRIASDPSNASHILGGTQDNGTQRTTGAINWSAAYGGDGGEVCFHRVNNNYILGETQNNGVFRSTNGGASFSSATSGLSGSGSWVGPLLSHPDSAGIYYTARQSVFKSTNWAGSWFSISSGTSGTIREMAISRSSPNVMYATSSATIYRSTNRGYTFSNVTSGLPGKVITSVNIHPDSSHVAVITFSGFGGAKIYKTTNTGSSWFSINGNLPDSPINDALIYYPGTPTSTYFAATDVGVFVSNDYGQNWIETANGLPNTVAIHLDYHEATNKLRVGTHGRGVFEIQLGGFLPVDVATVDAGVSGVQTFDSLTIVPEGTVRNLGSSVATFNVTRRIIEDGYVSTKTVSALAGSSDRIVNFDPWTFTPGMTYTVVDSVFINGDINNFNDKSVSHIQPYTGTSTERLCEGFTEVAYPPSGWSRSVISGTSTQYWSRSQLSSFGKGKGSSFFSFYNAPFGSQQALTSPVFSSSVAGDSLEFDYAYGARNSSTVDSVIVEASTNGGTQYSALRSLWGSNFGGNMYTAGANSSEFFPLNSQWARMVISIPQGTNRVRFRAYSGNGNNFYLDSVKIVSRKFNTTLNITAAPEGFSYSPNGLLNMTDTLSIYIREVNAPYAVIDSARALLDSSNFTASFILTNVSSSQYYLVPEHRNSLETWSKAGGESISRGIVNNYNFTSSLSQAYGSNQTVSVSGLVSVYSGDVDRDDAIDGSDVLQISNGAAAFLTGYAITDVDGNGFVDATDALIAENNAVSFVQLIRP